LTKILIRISLEEVSVLLKESDIHRIHGWTKYMPVISEMITTSLIKYVQSKMVIKNDDYLHSTVICKAQSWANRCEHKL